MLQSAEKFNSEKTGTQLSYVPKVCPSHHLENQVKFGIHTCLLQQDSIESGVVNELPVLQLLENFLLYAGLQSKVSCLEENLDSCTRWRRWSLRGRRVDAHLRLMRWESGWTPHTHVLEGLAHALHLLQHPVEKLTQTKTHGEMWEKYVSG